MGVKPSDIAIPKFEVKDPESIEDAAEQTAEAMSPMHLELAKLAKRVMWGTKPELYQPEIKKLVATIREQKEAAEATNSSKIQVAASMKTILKNSKTLKFKAVSNGLASATPINIEPKNHCFDGRKDLASWVLIVGARVHENVVS